VWDANLFYSAWLSLYGAAYLLINCPIAYRTTSSSSSSSPIAARRKKPWWYMTIFSSLCTSATLLAVRSGPSCSGTYLVGSARCSYARTAAILGIVAPLLSSLHHAVATYLHRRGERTMMAAGESIVAYLHPSHMDAATATTTASLSTTTAPRSTTTTVRDARPATISRYPLYLLDATALLIANGVVLVLVTSESGPGHRVGSAFLASWATFIASALYWKRCCLDPLAPSSSTHGARRPSYDDEAPVLDGLGSTKGGKRGGRQRPDGSSVGSTTHNVTDDEDEETSTRAPVDRLGAPLALLEDAMMLGDTDSDDDGIYERSHGSRSGSYASSSRQRGSSVVDRTVSPLLQLEMQRQRVREGHDRRRRQQGGSRSLPDPDGREDQSRDNEVGNTGLDAEGSYYSLSYRQGEDAPHVQVGSEDYHRVEDASHCHQEVAPYQENADYQQDTGVEMEEASIDYSAYYSGSDAVQVQVQDPQDDISGLSCLTALEQGSSRPNSFHRPPDASDPGGMRGSLLAPNAKASSRYQSPDPGGMRGSLLAPNAGAFQYQGSRCVQEPSVTGPRSAGICTPASQEEDPPAHQREPSQHAVHHRSPAAREPDAPKFPHSRRNVEGISRLPEDDADVDREWDFGATTPAPRRRAIDAIAVPTATADGGSRPHGGAVRPMKRRPSRDSLMSNLSPLQEDSHEGSTTPETEQRVATVATERGSEKSRSEKSSSEKSSSEKSSSEKSSSGVESLTPKNIGVEKRKGRKKVASSKSSKKKSRPAGRKTPPPPPSHPSTGKRGKKHQSRYSSVDVERGLSSGSSSFPVALSGGEAMKKMTLVATPSTKRMSTSSNPVTIPGMGMPREANDGSNANKSKDIDGCMAAMKDRQRKERGPTTANSHDGSSTTDFDILISDMRSVVTELTNEGFDAPVHSMLNDALAAAAERAIGVQAADVEQGVDNFPKRMPLYNGSEASSSQSRLTESPDAAGQQEVHSSVDAFLESAMSHARLSQSSSNLNSILNSIPPASGEESSVDPSERQSRGRRKSGGVNSGSSSGKSSSQGRRSKKSGASKKSKKSNGSRHGKLASRSKPNLPVTRNATDTSLHESYLERPQDKQLRDYKLQSQMQATALLEEMQAENDPHQSSSKNTGFRRESIRGSMQSFYSEEDSNILSMQDQDFAC